VLQSFPGYILSTQVLRVVFLVPKSFVKYVILDAQFQKPVTSIKERKFRIKRRCAECHEVKAQEQAGFLVKDRAGAEAGEEVLRQVLMGTAFAQTAVKERPTNYEFPAISRNSLNAGRL